MPATRAHRSPASSRPPNSSSRPAAGPLAGSAFSKYAAAGRRVYPALCRPSPSSSSSGSTYAIRRTRPATSRRSSSRSSELASPRPRQAGAIAIRITQARSPATQASAAPIGAPWCTATTAGCREVSAPMHSASENTDSWPSSAVVSIRWTTAARSSSR